jgi:phosphatidylglycerol lysyltransferase
LNVENGKDSDLLNRITWFRILRILIPFVLLALVYWTGERELKQLNLGKVIYDVRKLSLWPTLQIFGFTLLAVSVMSAYDFLIRRHFKLTLPAWTTFRFSWIANTLNNMIGFAGFAGAGLRSLLYRHRDISTATTASAVLFLSPIMITGLSLLAWFGIVGLISTSALLSEHRWLSLALWGMALYLPVFTIAQRTSLYAKWFNRSEGKLPWSTISASVSASFLEWFFAGMSFWLIIHHYFQDITVSEALGIFTISAIAGLMSMAPGGIGTFDLTALLGLQLLGADSAQAMAALVLFRLFYYLIPFLIGLALIAVEFAPSRKRMNQLAVSGWEQSLNAWQKIWSWPGQFGFLSNIGVWALSKLVLLSGLLLLLSAATPALLNRLQFMEEVLSSPLMKLSHGLSVMIGFILLVLSRGISLRVQRAYRFTLLLLFAGSFFTFAKAFDYEEALFLLVVACLLWICRTQFYRISAPFSRKTAIIGGVMLIFIALSYYILGVQTYLDYAKYLPVEWKLNLFIQPNDFAITTGLGILTGFISLFLLKALRPMRRIGVPPDEQEIAKLRHFLEKEPGNFLTHMLFLGDKSLYWAVEDKVLIPYARIRDKLVVLGDPLGNKEWISEGIQQFQIYADRYALTVVFYQVSPEYLPIYHENGYRFFKLGEEALVDVSHFTLVGKGNSALRSVKNRFEREGYRFEVVQPPFEPALINQLRDISDLWLAGRREKGFSLGRFEQSYLQLAPIAILRNSEGVILAFSTFCPSYDGGNVLSIDLMRHLPDTPNGTMDYLFVSILEWAKESGYQQFNLGMAPLSSVGQSHNAMRVEKIANIVFHHGGHWYGFEGLRRYKEKFKPKWEPRYLAYPAGVSLPILTLELAVLVSRKVKNNEF